MNGDFVVGTKVRARKHSRTGCITCKVRKKRCSEDKPICRDCKRLGFTCVYLPKNSDRGMLQQYKESIEKELFDQKFSKKKNKFPVVEEEIDDGQHQIPLLIQEPVSRDKHLLDVNEFEQHRIELPNSQGQNPEKTTAELPGIGLRYADEEELGNQELDSDLEELLDISRNLSSGSDTPHRMPRDLEEGFTLSPRFSQPLTDPVCLQLDDVGMHLYDYYRNHLANIISIAPTKQNYYLQVFLPMAHQHEGILYGLMAWSAHHLSITEGKNDTHSKDKHYLTIANKYTLSSLTRLKAEYNDNKFLWSLAQILILCAAEICQGDVTKWKILLKYGADLIEKNCDKDISKIMSSDNFNDLDATTKYWLIANFMYHDIMCSRQTFFPMSQYQKILNKQSTHDLRSLDDSNLQLDPLNGINRPILLLIGDITNLARKMKENKQTFNKSDPKFDEYMEVAMEIQSKLYQLSPSLLEMKLYDEFTNDYQLSIQLFQLMKIAALVHLKTICLKYSKDSIEVQYLWKKLSENLTLILGTKLEGSLCFPLFICGINAVDNDQKYLVELMFDDMMKRYKCYNFQRARTIMRKVWKQNKRSISYGTRSSVSSSSSGTDDNWYDLRNRDWYDIVDEMGWDISFA